jgi:UDP-N-acetylglucosamine 1-carboxyvinyltransferase
MEEFVIEGGIPLRGEVTPSGNKNAALPLLAACLLTAEPVILRNLPQIRDVQAMRKLIESLGAVVEELDANTWRITTRELTASHLDPDLCRRIRASILVAGPVLARAGGINLPPPGGDVIGRRRLDTHILGLRALGAKINYDRVFEINADELLGADILLDEASVTATENVVMPKARRISITPHPSRMCRNYAASLIFWVPE